MEKIQKLKKIHQEVKNHPFRLGNKKKWLEYHKLLEKLDEEFEKELGLHFKDIEYNGWGFFIHELRHMIWLFKFEYNDNKDRKKGDIGRFGLKIDDDEKEERKIYLKKRYGKFIPECQSKVVIVLEIYIQQIHKFILTKQFNEFLTYYSGLENWEIDVMKNGKSRWRKYILKENKFERL
jgi:hypothetical protein